ncbi:MAG TPA: response regulator transcription factor [Stellaceae bacterium]|nr:response regulator transcription factor [Stellaceae bacterium]
MTHDLSSAASAPDVLLLTPVSTSDAGGVERSPGRYRSRLPNEPLAPVTHIALIDNYSFTRQCISRALEGLGVDLAVLPFASFAEVPLGQTQIDLLLYHWHDNDTEFENLIDTLPSFREVVGRIPLILLSSVESPEKIVQILKNGARGYIPVESTTLELMLKIFELVEAGGTFIPEISLTLSAASPTIAAILSSGDAFTVREKAVLAQLKCGKPNKVIAHELSMSVSTVKAHVRSIMRKLRVRNRTEAVSRTFGQISLTAAIAVIGIADALAPLNDGVGLLAF